MPESPSDETQYVCHECGFIYHPPDRAALDGMVVLASCSTQLSVGEERIEVQGRHAAEVSAVARQLAQDAALRQQEARLRSPWLSGLFYLSALAVILVLFLVIGKVLAAWVVPVVIFGALLAVTTVGALQLRQDDRLSERGFLQLMGDVLRRLPLMLGRRGKEPDDSA